MAPDDLGRRRSVGLRRDRLAVPVPHVLRRLSRRELLERRPPTGIGSLIRSSPERGEVFLFPDHLRPGVHRTMFVGTTTALRTKTHGMGSMTLAELRPALQRVHGRLRRPVRRLGAASAPRRPRPAVATADGGAVAAVERATRTTRRSGPRPRRVGSSSRRTRTRTPAGAVTFTPVGLALDGQSRPGHHRDRDRSGEREPRVISYSGFSAATPATPGHSSR